ELDATPADLASDLETLSVCGVAPYTPMELVPVLVDQDEGTVEVWGDVPAMRGPVRLSAAEAGALAGALAAAGFEADEPLVVRLLSAASADFDAEALARTLRASASRHDPAVFEATAAAISQHEVLAIAYQREGADEPTLRRVEPLQLFAERGVWYLSAWCRKAGGHRTFRVDRIRAVEPVGEEFDLSARDATALGAVAFSARGLPSARLRFIAGNEFSEREWPGAGVAEAGPDGSLVVEAPFAGTDWIARRVLARLGRVEVLEPPFLREAVAQLARAELARL
ncbi:MAG: WYL domain-containing protein, partial [Actinomycetota bacterium]|nr:WYL domain-containing protein [Actinomycetota bacterium]